MNLLTRLCLAPLVVLLAFSFSTLLAEEPMKVTPRKALGEADERYWLESMIWYHGYQPAEIAAAMGLSETEIAEAAKRWEISAETRPVRDAEAGLLVMPYPGGRHPRIGFLEGAIDPQRETKVSVFTPWDPTSYVVADLPEALWSNLGLTYLAHTHIDTIWTNSGQTLAPQEWERLDHGRLRSVRKLPNGIELGSLVFPEKDHVEMVLWLHNGSEAPLSDLRVQNCVMLKAAKGFEAQTDANKVMRAPFATCRSKEGNRWVLTAWEPIQRAWANAPVPCLHADPKFPDCAPGETKFLEGWLSFYEGEGINEEMDRILKRWERRSEAALIELRNAP